MMKNLLTNAVERITNIKRRYVVLGSIILVVLLGLLVWYKWPYQEYKELGMRPQWTVADNILQASHSQIFARSVKGFEYTTFLSGEGPYTVFLPTDTSYEWLSPELKNILLSTETQGSARQIILYHIVPGMYKFSDLKDGTVLKTVQGEELIISHPGEQVLINGSSYIQTYDILAENGVIHTINGYLVPPSISGIAP